MRRLDDEGGAVAVIVAVLLVALMGFAALVIDVGALYAERRQLQNGADGAVLAIATDCGVAGNCGDYNATAQQFADANANDGAANVEDVCGSAASGLPGCVDPPAVAVGAGYARVRTRTGDAAAPDVMPPLLAQVLDPSYSGTTVRAEAIAAWGSLGGITDLFPLAFCWDHFNQLTNYGTNYGPPPYNVYYSNPPSGQESTCPTTNTYPGGFGWLDVTDPALSIDTATCTATAEVGGWEPGRPGIGLPNNATWNTCVNRLLAKILEFDSNPDAAPLLVPIFDDHQGTGGNGELRITGFGAFRPTGYRLSGGQSYPNSSVCGNPQDRCIRGYFMSWVVQGGVIGGGDYGVMTVQLMG